MACHPILSEPLCLTQLPSLESWLGTPPLLGTLAPCQWVQFASQTCLPHVPFSANRALHEITFQARWWNYPNEDSHIHPFCRQRCFGIWLYLLCFSWHPPAYQFVCSAEVICVISPNVGFGEQRTIWFPKWWLKMRIKNNHYIQVFIQICYKLYGYYVYFMCRGYL